MQLAPLNTGAAAPAPGATGGAVFGAPAPAGVPSVPTTGAPSSSTSGSLAGSSRGTTLFPLAALFYHKLTNVAYHRQKLRRIKYDEISSLFYDKKVCEYMLNIFKVSPKNESDRRMVEKGEVPGISDDLRRHAELRTDILSFSDQYDLNELVCLDYVVAVFRNPGLVRELEKSDSSKYTNYYDLNDHKKVLEAAMDLYVYERQAVLKSLLLLLKLSYMSEDSASSEKELDTVANVLASEYDDDGDNGRGRRDEDVILAMAEHLIVKNNLSSHLIGTAASLYSKAKRRHGISDDYHSQHDTAGDSQGFSGAGLKSLLLGSGSGGGSAAGTASAGFGAGSSSSSGNSSSSGGSNYLTPRSTILHQFAELHSIGEAIFYCFAVFVPPMEQVGKIQILTSCVSVELMKEDHGTYGDGGDYSGAGDDGDDSNGEFSQIYRACLHSFLISLQMTHMQSIKLLANSPREASLDSILGLIPSEYRKNMQEMVAPPLRWGEGVLLFSFVHVLASRGGFNDDGDFDSSGGGRASGVGVIGNTDSSNGDESKYALIFKGILAWVQLSRAFSFLRLGVLPVLQSSCKSSISASTGVGESSGGDSGGAFDASRGPYGRGGIGGSIDNTQISFNIIPDARYVNNTAGDLFMVLVSAVEVTADVFSSEELTEFHSSWYDISNLYAAVFAVYPPLGAKFILNEDNTSFRQAVTSCLRYTMEDSKAIIPALYLLAGLASGAEDALETVYRFLDKASPSASAPASGSSNAWGEGTRGSSSSSSAESIPNMSLHHFMMSLGECARICSGGATNESSDAAGGAGSSSGSVLKDNHEKVLIAILSLVQALCRSPGVCDLFLRDYRPLEVLFRLVCGPVSVSLKGCVFRTLAVIASSTAGVTGPATSSSSSSVYGGGGLVGGGDAGGASSTHDELWHLIESHRLLPSPYEGPNGGGTQSGSGVAGMTNVSMGMGGVGQSGVYNGNDMSGGNGAGGGMYAASSSAGGRPRPSRGGGSGGSGGRYGSGQHADDDEGVSLSYLQGLRLELEDSESKLGVYAITDSFLLLLEALLVGSARSQSRSNGRPHHDELGAGIRTPGILHYLEYLVCDVLLTTQDRFFINGAHGEGQRWRLLSRCFRVLSATLASYPVHLMPALRAKVDAASKANHNGNNGGSDSTGNRSALVAIGANGLTSEEQSLLVYLSADFDGLKTMASIAGSSNTTSNNASAKRGVPAGPASAGLYVMTLLLAWDSPVRSLLLEVLRLGASESFEISRKNNIYASAVQASKMGAVLGYGRHLDTRLSYSSTQGQGDVDGFHWRGKCVSAATELLYELSVREKAFYHCVTAAVGAPKVALMRVGDRGNSYIQSTVTIKPLSEILLAHRHAMGSLVATASMTGLVVQEMAMYSRRDLGSSSVAANISLHHPSSSSSSGSAFAGNALSSAGGVSSMAALVLVKALGECSIVAGEEFLEKILTHPGNDPASSSSGGDTNNGGYGGSKVTAREGREWSLRSLQACLLDTLRASLVDPSSHPRSCEPLCSQVVALGDDPCPFHESEDDDDEDENDNDGDRQLGPGNSGAGSKGKASVAAAAAAAPRARAGEHASGVVLQTLLSMLRGDKLALSHVLLGLVPALDPTYSNRWDLQLGASFSSTGGWVPASRHSQAMAVPQTVLGQILLLVEDSADIIQSQPHLASLCYQLLYTLCKHKITSSVVLAFLRAYSVNSSGRRMKFIPFVIKQVVGSLRAHTLYASDYDNNTNGDEEGGGGDVDRDSASASASALCGAWALKILSLEYRAIDSLARSERSILTSDLQELLSLYLDINTTATRGGGMDYAGSGDEEEEDEDDEDREFIGFSELLAAAVSASRVSTHGLTLAASVSVRVDSDLGGGGVAGFSSSESSSESPFSLGNALGSSSGRNNRSSTSLVSVCASDILSYPAVAACIAQATVIYSVEAGVVKRTCGNSGGSAPNGSRNSSAANGNASGNGGSGINSSSRGSQSDREVATGDWGSGSAGKDRHRSGGGTSTSGPHCFSIVDKAMFSTAFWASMGDNGDSGDNRRGGGGSSASIDDWPLEVQYSLALQAITLLNRHRRDLASSVYLLGAWEQCVSVMVALLGRHLARAATSAPLGSNSSNVGPPFSYQHSGEGGAQPSGSALLYDREANLRHYLRYLLRPTLSALDGSVDVLDSAVLEHLSGAVYTLVSGERLLSSSQYFPPVRSNIGSSSSLGKRKMSDSQQQPTAGGIDAPRDLGKDGCAPAAVRLPLSVLRRLVSVSLSLSAAPIRPLQAAMRLRGLAFASVACYLEPYLSMTPPYGVSKSATSPSNQSPFHVYDEDLGSSGNGATAAITAHLAANMSALTDALSREACEGPLVWRLSALSCLCRILSLVDSEALAGAARAIEANGLLSQLLPLAGVNPDAALSVRSNGGSRSSSSNNGTRTMSDGDGAEIRYATLSLCILLASVPEGHAAVTRGCGDDLCYLNLSALLTSYGLPSAPAQAQTAGLRGRRGELLTDQPAAQRWLLGVLPVLKLVQALALSSPSTIRAQTGCAQIVCQNTRAISHIVSAPWPALRKLLPRRSSDSYFDSSAGSSASGTSGGDSSSYPYLNGSAAATATALKVASTQQQACATVASLLKIVSSSLTFHSLGKELALRGQAAAADSASDSASRHASSAASRVRQEEGTELLASSRRQVHALVGSLIASNNGSGDDNEMGSTTGFDDVGVAATAPSLSTVTDLFATLARCLDSAMVSGEMNGAYGSAHDDAHTDAFSRGGGGDCGDYASEHGLSSMPQGVGGVTNSSFAETAASHGWSTHHHTALQHVLSTLESVSVVVRNMTTAHATHARLATVAMGTIAASSAASSAIDTDNVSGMRTRSSKSGSSGGGSFFGMDLLSQFSGGGASLSSLPEVLIKGHSSRAAAAGSGVPGFASGSSSGDASSSNDDLQLRIARLGQAVNDEFANLKFPLSRVLTLFLVLSSFDQLHAPYAHTIAARANAESGSSNGNGGGGLLLLVCLEGYAASVHHALENLIMVIYSEVLYVSTHACAMLPNEHNTGYHYCDANGEVILTAQTVSLLSRVMHHARSSFKLRATVDHQYRYAGDFDHHMHHAVTSSSSFSSSFGGHGSSSSNGGQEAEQRSLQVVSEIDILLSGLEKLRN